MNPKTRLIVAKPWVFIPASALSPFTDATPGLYYRCDMSIAQAPCPKCGSEIGEPCRGKLRSYAVAACHDRKIAANGDRLPGPSNLARIEIHFNDLEPWYGPDSKGQHESIKICWPVVEKSVEELGGQA